MKKYEAKWTRNFSWFIDERHIHNIYKLNLCLYNISDKVLLYKKTKHIIKLSHESFIINTHRG